MLKSRAICQSNCLYMGHKWLKPVSSGKSRKKVTMHYLGKNRRFWSKLAIMAILDAILEMKYYFNPKKPLIIVTLGPWQ